MPEWYPVVLTMARTGLREGEALALQPGDLDFAQGRVWVRRTWGSRRAALGAARINAPKGNRERPVDMSQQLARVLEGYVMLREAEALMNGRAPSPWLFPAAAGGP